MLCNAFFVESRGFEKVNALVRHGIGSHHGPSLIAGLQDNKHREEISNAFKGPSKFVALVAPSRVTCARATDQGGPGFADDTIVGSHSLPQLSHRATAGNRTQDHDPTQHCFALASAPIHQRWLPAIWTPYVGKAGYRRTHGSEGGTSRCGNCATDASTDEPVELIVFYAGQIGVPLTIDEE